MPHACCDAAAAAASQLRVQAPLPLVLGTLGQAAQPSPQLRPAPCSCRAARLVRCEAGAPRESGVTRWGQGELHGLMMRLREDDVEYVDLKARVIGSVVH